MLQFIVVFFIASLLNSFICSAQIQVPGGTVFKTIIRNTQFNFDQKYAAFIPEGVSTIRGILIHQHGCTMEGTGEPIVFDLQYQAFAKKWNLVIIGPDLYTQCNDTISGWVFPEKYSGNSLLTGIDSVARLSGHAELKTAPWLLWGHSGGGFWALSMAAIYTSRTMAVFAYSPAFDPTWNFPSSIVKVPIMIRHAGATDLNTAGINCWETALHTFDKLRKMNGNVSIAYTPGQNHNFSYVRYMALPFFESVLTQRIPDLGSTELKDMDDSKAWLGDTTTHKVYKLSGYAGDKLAMSWLPDSITAEKWSEYVKTGTVVDITNPPAPFNAEITNINSTTIDLTWNAAIDLESGLKYFNIYMNNIYVQRFPLADDYQDFSTNGDHPSPVSLPEMKSRLSGLTNRTDTIEISTVNKFGLESAKLRIIRNQPKGISQKD